MHIISVGIFIIDARLVHPFPDFSGNLPITALPDFTRTRHQWLLLESGPVPDFQPGIFMIAT
ncbi:hypothetical protein KDK_80520 [Dictyobacter kobayashii]|uniref:Uncharacterized protein n=1 Tax=Dictyobacter kobayashii TaxID=2014872 RepID=A0A402AYS3_9CHLR|nr:hypothetical protein KDK_80520 [Dictyobacter kobayashii]